MRPRHLVNGVMGGWFIFGRIVGPLALASGIGILAVGEPAGWALIVIGGALTLCMEVAALWQRRKRVWIEVLPDGMLVVDRTGTRELRDHDIVSIAYHYKAVYSNGAPAGFVRTARLWPAKSAVIELSNKYGEGKPDPMSELLQRITVLLKAGFARALEHGVEVGGDGWQLNRQQLRCKVGGREEVIPVLEIAAVQSFEGKMSVWVRGKDLPSVQLPDTGRNVWLLPDLLEPYLKPVAADGPAPGTLGRILFSRSPSRVWVILAGIGAVLSFLIGILLLLVGLREPDMLWIGAIVTALSPILALTTAHLAVATFRCQEWGVYQRGLWSKRQLLYKQVESFSYGATRHYHNGVYTGTHLNLRFTPYPGAGPAIAYSATVQGGDDDLDNLRGFVSQTIAVQMHERLHAGQTVPWTANLEFTPKGLTYRPAGFLGRKNPEFLPYENYHGHNMDQGVFYLFAKGAPKAVMSENVSEANFFPGFHLLLMLLHSPQESAEVAENDAAGG